MRCVLTYRRYGVGGNICAQLSKSKGCCNKEHPRAIARCAFIQEGLQKFERIPDRLAAKDNHRRRRYNDPYKGCKGESSGNREKLRPESILRLLSETGEIRIINYAANY